ncbi:hypothetical protein [Pedobacter frigidisoli]|uniref:hypothetical protein n=1 Tax=Pedobacter frigidisoli TaxID=2530455 RepID=UPI00292ED79F|nr:hypothetical protein [Pedobacter frigidisoli]
MKSIKVIIAATLLILVSCERSAKKNNDKKITKINNEQANKSVDMVAIRRLIEEQKDVETEENEPEKPYKLSENDFAICRDIIAEGLKESGYKFISEEDFNKKLFIIFKITPYANCDMVSSKSSHITLFGKAMDGSKNTRLQNQYDLYNYTENLFIVQSEKFLTQTFLVKDLVKINGNSINIILPKFIIARNKYLFNDSKTALSWLIKNDKEFLRRLVSNFGYDKEEMVNQLVLEDVYEEYSNPNHNMTEKIVEIFFKKNCEGKLQIQEGLLNFVSRHTSKDDDRYIYSLGNYLDYLFKDDKDLIFNEPPMKNFSIEEKAKIVAFVANVESQAFYRFKPLNRSSTWRNATTSLYYISASHPEILEIIKKNDYYHLSDLKDVIEGLQFKNEH